MQKTKKTGFIASVLIVSVLLLGTSLALWDKTLFIHGTVNTGEVDMQIISISSDDSSSSSGDLGDDKEGKDVGWTEVYIDPDDDQTAIVIIHNGYPCYEDFIHFTAHNDGTIPVKLQEIIVDAPSEITVVAWNGIGEQLEPGDRLDPLTNGDNTIYVHVEQEADELGTYTFTVSFRYVQWNEYEP